MIIDRLPIRLYWHHMSGYARKDGKRVQLTRPPDMPFPIEAIDYAPQIVAMVMPKYYGWRDLLPHEIEWVKKVLDDLVASLPEG